MEPIKIFIRIRKGDGAFITSNKLSSLEISKTQWSIPTIYLQHNTPRTSYQRIKSSKRAWKPTHITDLVILDSQCWNRTILNSCKSQQVEWHGLRRKKSCSGTKSLQKMSELQFLLFYNSVVTSSDNHRSSRLAYQKKKSMLCLWQTYLVPSKPQVLTETHTVHPHSQSGTLNLKWVGMTLQSNHKWAKPSISLTWLPFHFLITPTIFYSPSIASVSPDINFPYAIFSAV